ncbi:TPA: AAA family ATPase [Streptococcus suis]
MINRIEIESFKSISKMTIDLRNFNLFLGTNSSGKSTILQALLVLYQTQMLNEKTNPLHALNGDIVSLGHFEEVRSKNTGSDIEIKIFENDLTESVKISSDSVIVTGANLVNRVKYLSASRIGALDVYPESFSDSQYFSPDGSFLISYLQNNKKKSLDAEILKNEDSSDTLLIELNYWLRKILDTELKINDIAQTDLVQITYDVKGNRISNRPKNLGTGTSYIISILIMCLASDVNDILIIENPELHLHPKAQSALTEFLIHIAKTGRQLFIESHSDHVFNAVRVEVAKDQSADQQDSKNLFGINFIELNERFESINHPINIVGKGDVENPKDGLFDQFDNDLLKMLGLM